MSTKGYLHTLMNMHSNRTNQSSKPILIDALSGRDAFTDVAFPI